MITIQYNNTLTLLFVIPLYIIIIIEKEISIN